MEEHFCDRQRNISRVSCCQFIRLLNDTSRIPFCDDNDGLSEGGLPGDNSYISSTQSPSFISAKKSRNIVPGIIVKSPPPPELPNFLTNLTRRIHHLFTIGKNSTGPPDVNELTSIVLRHPTSVKKQEVVLAKAFTKSELDHPHDISNSSTMSSLPLSLHLDGVPSVEVLVEEDHVTFIFGIFLLISVAVLCSMFILRLTRPRLPTFSFASATYATLSGPLCFASTTNPSSSSSSTRSCMDYRDTSSLMLCHVPLSFLGGETCRRCQHRHHYRRGGTVGAAATHRQKGDQRNASESNGGTAASSSSAAALLKNAGDGRKTLEESSKIKDSHANNSKHHRHRSTRHQNSTHAPDPLMLVLLQVMRSSCGRDSRNGERPAGKADNRHRGDRNRSITNVNRHSAVTSPPISLSIVSNISSGEGSTHVEDRHHHHQRPLLLPSYQQSLAMMMTPSQSLTISTAASMMSENISSSSSANASHSSAVSSSIPPPPYDEL